MFPLNEWERARDVRALTGRDLYLWLCMVLGTWVHGYMGTCYWQPRSELNEYRLNLAFRAREWSIHCSEKWDPWSPNSASKFRRNLVGWTNFFSLHCISIYMALSLSVCLDHRDSRRNRFIILFIIPTSKKRTEVKRNILRWIESFLLQRILHSPVWPPVVHGSKFFKIF